ncbi:hypothetical protein TWF696_002500 [Orbilia brochopaga]|uniref:Xylose isomerase-like TIM barrel domain-containing protein n=1 Tax=Orbilia brochopaga TaxID=3140254 RepID=A0AAV9U4H0_9PEZI
MTYKLAIPTRSLGHASANHSLVNKLDAAKGYGYQGVEICFEDLLSVANEQPSSPAQFCPNPSLKWIDVAAVKVKGMCEEKGIEIVCLQLFHQYEGLVNALDREVRFLELVNWIQIARILGTRMIIIPAASLPADETTKDLEVIANYFRQAADAGLMHCPHIHIAYESQCSATYIDRWEFCWDVVRKVDRHNFGMCLDTFHMAACIFADPTIPSGCLTNGATAVELSMQRLVKAMEANCEKIFHVQIGDARLPDEPIVPGSPDYDPEQWPRTVWSENYRLFYREEGRGAYLPIMKISDTIFNHVGYEGWVSLEIFNRVMNCENASVPEELARRGAVSWQKLIDDMGWWVPPANLGVASAVC